MDKKIIKKYLVSEVETPGIKVTNAIENKNKKINSDGIKDIDKDLKKYDKDLKQEDSGKKNMAINKYNYTDTEEKTYHDEMETLNGLEMNRYTSEPGEEFRGRAQKAMEGDSTMGNAIGGNAEPAWGASDSEFGKKLANRVRQSEKKRDDAFIATYELGDKIMALPDDHKIQRNDTAIGKTKIKTTGDNTKVGKSATPKEKNVNESMSAINKETNKYNMKKLVFKKEFNGVGNALKLIPESYKVDNKKFVMTDNNESYTIKWEGSLTEGRAVILTASNKSLVNEDIQRMKDLFNYKSSDTLGLVKGQARINENEAFIDVWNKTKKILIESEEDEMDEEPENLEEAENIEGKKPAKTAPFEKAGTKFASPEVSAATGKKLQAKDGTVAKAPVKDADKAVDYASKEIPNEAKKKLQAKDGTAPAPKTDDLKKSGIKQAPEAKKHIKETEEEITEDEDDELKIDDNAYETKGNFYKKSPKK